VCHEEWPKDEATISAWQALADRAPFATGFHQPTWQRAVCQTLGKTHRLRLITVWEKGEGGSGGRLRAVLPMSLRDNHLLESLCPTVTDYLDPLIEPDCEVQVWPIVLKMFRALRQGVNKNISLHHVRDDAPCRGILREMAWSEGFDFAENVTQFAPQLALPPSWEEFLATLDAHERKETRRKINKVMTKGAGRLVRCSSDSAEISRALTHAFGLMEQAPGKKGVAVKKLLRPLLEKAAPPLIMSGKLWLTTLYVNEVPAAITLQFAHAGGPMLWNCGFDNSKREWSPGIVLTAETIRLAIEAGAPKYDLLNGQEQYKYRLGAKDVPLWRISLRKA